MTRVLLLVCALGVACGVPRVPHPSNSESSVQRRVTLRPDGSLVVAATYSRSGRHVAAAGALDAVRVWNVATGQQVGALANGGQLVSPGADDDTFLIYHTSKWTFTVWNWRTGSIRRFSAYDALAAFGPTADAASTLAIISQLAVSPDGTRLLTLDEHATGLVLWDVATGTPQRFIATEVNAVAFLPDGTHAVAAGTHLSVYDLETGIRSTLRDSIRACDDLAVSNDGKRIVLAQGFAGGPTSVEVLALPDGTPIRSIAIGPTRWLYGHAAMTLSADGSTLLIATGVQPEILPSQAILVDVATGATLATFIETLSSVRGDPARRISSLALAPDGSSLVIGYREIALYSSPRRSSRR